jgi:hypothetical protein
LWQYFFWLLGIVDAAHGAVTHDASDCLYFSIVIWSTLGYGDFRPTQAARLVAASEAIMGYVVMAIVIGISAQRTAAWSQRPDAV